MSETLCSAASLQQHLDDLHWLIVDCRFDLADPAAGAAEYHRGHLPGAVYAHLDEQLSDHRQSGLGRHPLPSAEAFSATLSAWGLHADSQVVCLDHGSGAVAARWWWLLRSVGHAQVSVLDGGMAAWSRLGLPLTTALTARPPTRYPVTFANAKVVDYAEVASARSAADRLLIDARAAERFAGQVEPIDPVAGHVPGAVNRPFQQNLDGNGGFKSAAALNHEFSTLLAGRDPERVIHMCGSGVTACHNLLAMERAGLTGSRLFAPSWSGWICDPRRPVATDAA